jgi:hypothetical protein
MVMDMPTVTGMMREYIHAQLGSGSYEEVNRSRRRTCGGGHALRAEAEARGAKTCHRDHVSRSFPEKRTRAKQWLLHPRRN